MGRSSASTAYRSHPGTANRCGLHPASVPPGADGKDDYDDTYDLVEDYEPCDDDPDDFPKGRSYPSWKLSRSSFHPSHHLPRPTIGQQNVKNNTHKRVASASLYYKWDPLEPMSNQVA